MIDTVTDIDLPILELSIIGFDDDHRFTLVRVDESGVVCELRSLDHDDLSFVVVPPHVFFPEYSLEIKDEVVDYLRIESATTCRCSSSSRWGRPWPPPRPTSWRPSSSTCRTAARSRSSSSTRATASARRSRPSSDVGDGAHACHHEPRHAWPGSVDPMLVLSRRVGESIVIGDEVVVTVLEVRGDVVRIGVDAPRSVAVNRAELLDEIGKSNRAAASPTAAALQDLTREVQRRTGR